MFHYLVYQSDKKLITFLKLNLNGIKFLVNYFRSDECFRMLSVLGASKFCNQLINFANRDNLRDLTILNMESFHFILDTIEEEVEKNSRKIVSDFVDICMESLNVSLFKQDKPVDIYTIANGFLNSKGFHEREQFEHWRSTLF